MLRRVLCLLLVLSFSASLSAAAERRRAVVRQASSILLIGNSLTYTNDLPAIVCRMATAAGKALVCDSLTMPGAALEDHLAAGTVQPKLDERKWSIVALQQGPSALPASRVNLLETVRIFGPMIRGAGARPALYQVWPSRARFFDFEASCESYRLAANEIDGLLFPAGRAWQAAWRRDASLPLYDDDEFHPSVAGSYLAALTIYQQLFGGIPEIFATAAVARDVTHFPLSLSDGQLSTLRDAAVEACEGERESQNLNSEFKIKNEELEPDHGLVHVFEFHSSF